MYSVKGRTDTELQGMKRIKKNIDPLTPKLSFIISNSPYCLPKNPYDASLENLVLDQLIIT